MSETKPLKAGLYLVATPIGNLGDLSARAREVLAAAAAVACEDTRRTGRLFQLADIRPSRWILANEHTEARAAAEVAELIESGAAVALVSDAGTPMVSDPGARMVGRLIDAGHPVTLVPGPSAPLAALVLSGLPTERFVMDGFLARRGAERARQLADVARQSRTTVLLESPKRVAATLRDLAEVCGSDRPAAVARELTKLHEQVVRGSLADLVEAFPDAPKGEIVIVVGGAPPATHTDDDLVRAVNEALERGESRRDAVAGVASAYGVSRNRVYDLALIAAQEPATPSTYGQPADAPSD